MLFTVVLAPNHVDLFSVVKTQRVVAVTLGQSAALPWLRATSLGKLSILTARVGRLATRRILVEATRVSPDSLLGNRWHRPLPEGIHPKWSAPTN